MLNPGLKLRGLNRDLLWVSGYGAAFYERSGKNLLKSDWTFELKICLF